MISNVLKVISELISSDDHRSSLSYMIVCCSVMKSIFFQLIITYLKISEEIRGARAAIRDTIPFPT